MTHIVKAVALFEGRMKECDFDLDLVRARVFISHNMKIRRTTKGSQANRLHLLDNPNTLLSLIPGRFEIKLLLILEVIDILRPINTDTGGSDILFG